MNNGLRINKTTNKERLRENPNWLFGHFISYCFYKNNNLGVNTVIYSK